MTLAKYFFSRSAFPSLSTLLEEYSGIVPWKIYNLEASTHNISYTRSLNGREPFTFDAIGKRKFLAFICRKRKISVSLGLLFIFGVLQSFISQQPRSQAPQGLFPGTEVAYLRLCSHLVYPSTCAWFSGTRTSPNIAFLSVPDQKSGRRARAMRYVQGYSSTW